MEKGRGADAYPQVPEAAVGTKGWPHEIRFLSHQKEKEIQPNLTILDIEIYLENEPCLWLEFEDLCFIIQ